MQVGSDKIVYGVIKNDISVEYLLFDDGGRIYKKENQIKAYKRIVNFLDKYLKKESSSFSSEYSIREN